MFSFKDTSGVCKNKKTLQVQDGSKIKRKTQASKLLFISAPNFADLYFRR